RSRQRSSWCCLAVRSEPVRCSFIYGCGYLSYLHSFPTRRSSDLSRICSKTRSRVRSAPARKSRVPDGGSSCCDAMRTLLTNVNEDRKSTRLNSSHVKISYAVFCLKKKNNEPTLNAWPVHQRESSI